MGVYRSGRPTAEHDKVNVDVQYKPIYEAALRHAGGTIIDVFGGGGRDSAKIHSLAHGNGRFVLIDADPLRLDDALLKTDAQGNSLFIKTTDKAALETAFSQRRIALIQGEFPQKPFGETDIDLKHQANLVLCVAGLMFVPPVDLEKTIAALASLLAPGGEMYLRYVAVLKDPKHGAFEHAPETVMDFMKKYGLKITRNADLPDLLGRASLWVDVHCQRTSEVIEQF